MDYTVSTETEGASTVARFTSEDPEAEGIASTAVVVGSVDPDHPFARFDEGFVEITGKGISAHIGPMTLSDVDGRVLAAALTAHYAALDDA